MATDKELIAMHSEQIARLETKLQLFDSQTKKEFDDLLKLDREIMESLVSLREELHDIKSYQKQHESTLDSLNTIVHGSTVIKWLIVGIVATFSTVGVVLGAFESIRAFMSK